MGSDPVGSGPMCPFCGNTVRFSPMGREFGMSTTGGHILRFAPMFGEFAMPASKNVKRNTFVVTAHFVCPNAWNQQGRCSFSVFSSASASSAEAPLTPR